MKRVEGLEAREAALRILDSVLRRGATLDSAAGQANRLNGPDRAFAIAIAGEVLRRLPDLDSLIDSATRNNLPSDSKARMVLRMAIAQRAVLETPDHAVVSTSLPLLAGGPRRLVHGVLGTLLRRGLPDLSRPRLPEAVEQRWQEAWGRPIVDHAREAIGHRPPVDLTFSDSASARDFAAANGGRSFAPHHVRLAPAGSIPSLPGFAEGKWWVQDLAASIPARLVPERPQRVLDLCAAPGGKTMQLAAAGHQVTAVDRSASRLARLRENLDRTGLEARLVEADAMTFEPRGGIDSILLDAPCSATGTFRRHPEVLHRATSRIIAESVRLQKALLRRSAELLPAGGTLVYSVCSLEPAEGESVIADFLSGFPRFRIAPAGKDELPEGMTSSPEGWVRFLPGDLAEEGGLDGFFIARLVDRG